MLASTTTTPYMLDPDAMTVKQIPFNINEWRTTQVLLNQLRNKSFLNTLVEYVKEPLGLSSLTSDWFGNDNRITLRDITHNKDITVTASAFLRMLASTFTVSYVLHINNMTLERKDFNKQISSFDPQKIKDNLELLIKFRNEPGFLEALVEYANSLGRRLRVSGLATLRPLPLRILQASL
jgi:hypothetical protein